jgi:membrane protease YdiL (CAAX protease family)
MARGQPIRIRDLAELIFGYGLIVGIIWSPERLQQVLAPIALVATAAVVLARNWDREELGFGVPGLVRSLWILPAAVAFALLCILAAKKIGTLHPLYHADASHITGYVLWTIYQQFLLQDYFMPRLLRLLPGPALSVAVTAMLFALAHLPNLSLAAATLAWGLISCLLFRRYHNLWALGLAQGLLGLCFAVCVPDALSHHLRVGLGYVRYHAAGRGR